MILGTAAFLYMIKYYRYRMNVERDTIQKLQLRADELSAEVTSLKSQKQKTQSRTF
jgi:FtsZ-binding cell division protein ZapB